MTKKIHYLLVSATLLGLFSGCGFVERNTIGLFADPIEPKETKEVGTTHEGELENPAAPVAIDKLQSKAGTSQNGQIELTWAVPDEQVDGYVIRYGLTRANLDHEVQVTSSEIEKINDGRSHEIYRYVLNSVPTDKAVYVAIAARRGEEITPLSEIREILP